MSVRFERSGNLNRSGILRTGEGERFGEVGTGSQCRPRSMDILRALCHVESVTYSFGPSKDNLGSEV